MAQILRFVQLAEKKALEFAKNFNDKNSTKHNGYKLDIKRESSMEKLVDDVINDFGQIDCLVNNAFFTGECDINNFSALSLQKGFDGTIKQVSILVNKCTNALEKSKRCNIINISSM